MAAGPYWRATSRISATTFGLPDKLPLWPLDGGLPGPRRQLVADTLLLAATPLLLRLELAKDGGDRATFGPGDLQRQRLANEVHERDRVERRLLGEVALTARLGQRARDPVPEAGRL